MYVVEILSMGIVIDYKIREIKQCKDLFFDTKNSSIYTKEDKEHIKEMTIKNIKSLYVELDNMLENIPDMSKKFPLLFVKVIRIKTEIITVFELINNCY